MNTRIPPIKSDIELEKIILDESMPIIFEALTQLLDQKPKDGMEFLADFFQSRVKTDPLIPSKKKKKTTSLVSKSNDDLDCIIRNHSLSATTISSFFSPDQEERSRAGLAILTSENQKLVEEILDRLSS